jgi:hypothetical protein
VLEASAADCRSVYVPVLLEKDVYQLTKISLSVLRAALTAPTLPAFLGLLHAMALVYRAHKSEGVCGNSRGWGTKTRTQYADPFSTIPVA